MWKQGMFTLKRMNFAQKPRTGLVFNMIRTLVTTENTPNPNWNKYFPGKEVLGKDETMDFSNKKFASMSPLAQELFGIPGVTRVFFGDKYISVTKSEEVSWGETIENEIKDRIEKFNDNEIMLLSEEIAEGTEQQKHVSQEIQDDDSEAVAMIKEILATRVRPFVKEDGGDVAFIDFDEGSGVVTLLMKGSCAGCPSSGATLKGGIENMLKHYVAEVNEVVGVDEIPE